MKHRFWVALSGFIWFFMGCFLLYKGLHFLAQAAFTPHSLCDQMKGIFGTAQQAAVWLIGIGLFVGFIKGRFILVKTVRRVINRIASLPLPIRLRDAYAPSYWILIGCMMCLGMVMRFLPIDIRGTVDVAIGSALIHGSFFYFRATKTIYDTGSPAQFP